MPIEFRCQNCQRLLRTQDDTAGKKAQCPGCAAIVPIPGVAAPAAAPQASPPLAPPRRLDEAPLPHAPPVQPPRPQQPAWPAAGRRPPPVSPVASANPYQSPSLSAYEPAHQQQPARLRSGPAWERRGASTNSFTETVKSLFASASFFFADMRRDGGLAAPLGFGLVGGLLYTAANVVWFGVFMLMVLAVPDANNNDPGSAMLGGVFFALGLAIMLPLLAVGTMIVSAGTYHLMLMLLGSGEQGFETTFRVVAYSLGTTSLLAVVPCCGLLLPHLVYVVFTIIGLSQAHETSGLKAAAAVLLPNLVCGGGLGVAISVSTSLLSS